MDIEFDDVWTDEIRAARQADPSFNYAYLDLTTPAPTSNNCMLQGWAANCRTVINYETHIHPLWATVRPVLDPATGQPPIDPVTGLPVLDPVTGLPLTNTCTNCHIRLLTRRRGHGASRSARFD